MAESRLTQLQKELDLSKWQLNAIYEFSTTLQPTSNAEDIMRVFFSILMGNIGISRAFFFDQRNSLFYKKGFKTSESEKQAICDGSQAIEPFSCLRMLDADVSMNPMRDMLIDKQIHYLISFSDNQRVPIVLGLGQKLNQLKLSGTDLEFIFFLSRFALIALNNVYFFKQLLEKKRMEYEISVASQIQRSLLPQELPTLKHFDIAVLYKPIREVGGDYYDMFARKKSIHAIVLADVEGKGLPAALLAASSQAIFHAMNELYLFQPAKFIKKANTLISEITRGDRFITLFWILLDDENLSLTYVNAGHNPPFLIRGEEIIRFDKGGIFLGFLPNADFEQEIVPVQSGDILVAYTDGVSEVQNGAGTEYGEKRIIRFARRNRHLPVAEIADRLDRDILTFSQKEKFRDDFTILMIKVK